MEPLPAVRKPSTFSLHRQLKLALGAWCARVFMCGTRFGPKTACAEHSCEHIHHAPTPYPPYPTPPHPRFSAPELLQKQPLLSPLCVVHTPCLLGGNFESTMEPLPAVRKPSTVSLHRILKFALGGNFESSAVGTQSDGF